MRWTLLFALAGIMVLTVSVEGQQIHRNPFEGRNLSWQRGAADAPYQDLGFSGAPGTRRP